MEAYRAGVGQAPTCSKQIYIGVFQVEQCLIYACDNEGNLLTKTRFSDGQRTEYTWDYRNRLVRVVVKDAAGTVLHEERYTSDVLDRRCPTWRHCRDEVLDTGD
jgi:YD repeat-containing protein